MKSLKGRRVLVTGGAGFIGSHLVDKLLELEVEKVVVVDNFLVGKMENLNEAKKHENLVIYNDDARHFGVMQAIMEKENIEVVYNLATIALNYSFFNPIDAYMVNVEIANTLLTLQKVGAFKTLIHSSSSEAYGSVIHSPMDELHPLNPTTPYAAGKAAADLMVMSFYNVLDLDISVIRPFNNYGPRQNIDGPLAGIIPLTAKRLFEGQKPVVNGTGEQTRDFVYVGDTVRAFILAYENEKSRGKIINLGSGIETPMIDLVKEICRYYKYNGDIEFQPERKADVLRHCASAKRAKSLLGFEPEVGLREGLAITLDWYEKNKKKTSEPEKIIERELGTVN